MESPNRMALDLVDEAIDFADELHVGVRRHDVGTTVLDFGVDRRGGVEAGLLLAAAATGDLASVGTRVGQVDGAGLTHVELVTDHPDVALVDCQRPRWELEIDGSAARGSGPAQLLRDGPDDARHRDDAEFAVLAVEAAHLPAPGDVDPIAGAVDLDPGSVFVLVAPAASIAGSVSAAARAAERGVYRLTATGYDPGDVLAAAASAPVASVASSSGEARARSTAAIAAGSRVHLTLDAPVESTDELAGGHPGGPDAPAQLTLDVRGGRTTVVGSVDEERLADALGL